VTTRTRQTSSSSSTEEVSVSRWCFVFHEWEINTILVLMSLFDPSLRLYVCGVSSSSLVVGNDDWIFSWCRSLYLSLLRWWCLIHEWRTLTLLFPQNRIMWFSTQEDMREDLFSFLDFSLLSLILFSNSASPSVM
jgi:hypothetical protein